MASILESVLNGGRVSRNGDFVIVVLPNMSFAAPAMEFQQAQQWARSRVSNGNPNRDRMDFIARFEALLARQGSGIASRGSNKVLAMLVTNMEQAGMSLDDWLIPRGIFDSVEIRKKAKSGVPDNEDAATPADDAPDEGKTSAP